MKPIVALTAVAVFGFSSVAVAADPGSKGSDAAEQSVVRGQVSDVDKKPVSGAEIVLLNEDGQEIARTKTDANGAYSLGCVDLGSYQHQISAAGFKGQKVAAPLGPNGLVVAWAVDPQKPALASATASGGPCVGSVAAAGTIGAAGAEGTTGTVGAVGADGGTVGGTPAIVLGGGALAAGAGVGIAAGAGAFDSDSGPGTGAQ